jgi:hypothetical protein
VEDDDDDEEEEIGEQDGFNGSGVVTKPRAPWEGSIILVTDNSALSVHVGDALSRG